MSYIFYKLESNVTNDPNLKIGDEMFSSRVSIYGTNLKNRLKAILVLQGIVNAKTRFFVCVNNSPF